MRYKLYLTKWTTFKWRFRLYLKNLYACVTTKKINTQNLLHSDSLHSLSQSPVHTFILRWLLASLFSSTKAYFVFPRVSFFLNHFLFYFIYFYFLKFYFYLFIFLKKLLLFSYSCVSFLPIPPPHPSQNPSLPHLHPLLTVPPHSPLAISKWVDQKTMVYLHNGILRSREKEGA